MCKCISGIVVFKRLRYHRLIDVPNVVDITFTTEEFVVRTTVLVWAAEEEDIIGKFVNVTR